MPCGRQHRRRARPRRVGSQPGRVAGGYGPARSAVPAARASRATSTSGTSGRAAAARPAGAAGGPGRRRGHRRRPGYERSAARWRRRAGRAPQSACSSVMISGGSRRSDAVVPAAQLDDEPAVQALRADRAGQRRVRPAGRRSASGAASGSTSSTPIIRPAPAHVADAAVLGAAAARSSASIRAPSLAGPVGQPFSRDVAQGRGAGRHRELVAAEGAGVRAGRPGVELLPVDDHGQRQAAADRLGQHHDVRDDAAVLDRPERAGAADAGLDLVDDERDAALRGDPAHLRAATRPAPGPRRPRPAPARRSSPRAAARRRAGRRAASRRTRARSPGRCSPPMPNGQRYAYGYGRRVTSGGGPADRRLDRHVADDGQRARRSCRGRRR